MNQNDKPPPSPGLITSIHCPRPARADPIAARIKAKTADYSSYEFTEPQSGALNIFFDLVQEFESEEDFRAICVMVPKVIFGLDCALYLVTPKLNLRCIACTGSDALHPGLFQTSPAIPQHPDRRDEHWYFPIRANPRHIKELPFDPPGDVIGCLEVHPAERMASGDSLFWEKYANRIGFQLHNRMMHETNERHLRFIRSLAKDIGHNVIVPNMYFKLFFNRLKRTIDQLGPLQRRMLNAGSPHCADVMDLQTKLDAQFSEIITHYEQTSLYLETLLRQSHFEKGHYVLERRACDMVTQIIEPQLHHYLPRLAENNIEVDQCPPPGPSPANELYVDVGLMAQVYANLFSNALKYTSPPQDGSGQGKSLSCSIQRIPHALGPGKPGIRFGLFTTGPPIPEETGSQLFQAGVRGSQAEKVEGTGHGLFFVKQIVELHGGRVGQRATASGNEFYLILPATLTARQAVDLEATP
ncbi:sensor histidine kinase [Desulfovibrio ferrophilus]|uniref:histidine kinase n=1 Tax=Desulfovibrio ferrophilus TaxID=241368 RepID=A0A2Z6B184_9BACT|nr:HAMP domain-containing sensor histidine kinase [Desulfovibrio ferrophilus]BBD09156.1 histidine kinase [Desulfovibrio ferrophilus]